MKEEKDHYYNNSELMDLVKRYEEMILNGTSYYFDVDDFEEIIDHYLDLGRLGRAYNVARHALMQHPSSTSIQLKSAVILNEKSQPLEALRILRTIEKIEIYNPEVYYTKGVAFNLLGQLKDAVKQFNKAIILTDEGKADMIFSIAMVFEHKNKFRIALKYLLQAYEIEPFNLSYIYDIAYCYERVDKLDKALEFYNRFLDIDPFSENVWYNIGVLYNRLEDYDKALDAYEYAISLDEEYASAYFNKANTLANRGDHRDAIAVYKELLYLEENNEQVVCYIGECYEKMEEWDKALEYYRKTLVINPDFADAWLGSGMVMYARGSYRESLYCVEKALGYFPENPEYLYSLGNVYLKLKRPHDAIDAYRKAVGYDPRDFDSWINLAETYLDIRENEKAIRILEEASVINPGIAVLNYRLAAYYFMNGEKEKANHFLRIALALDFDLHNDFFAYYPAAERLASVRKLIDAYRKK